MAIVQEHIHDVRFIPLDGRPHIPGAVRQYAGDSRGRWEGDTLVVETTHFNAHAFIRNFTSNLSDALHVVERFTRVDADTIDYEFTVTDPNTWTRPRSPGNGQPRRIARSSRRGRYRDGAGKRAILSLLATPPTQISSPT